MVKTPAPPRLPAAKPHDAAASAAVAADHPRVARQKAVADVRRDPALAKSGSAPMYGMAAAMPVRFLVASRVRDVIAKLYAGDES